MIVLSKTTSLGKFSCKTNKDYTLFSLARISIVVSLRKMCPLRQMQSRTVFAVTLFTIFPCKAQNSVKIVQRAAQNVSRFNFRIAKQARFTPFVCSKFLHVEEGSQKHSSIISSRCSLLISSRYHQSKTTRCSDS